MLRVYLRKHLNICWFIVLLAFSCYTASAFATSSSYNVSAISAQDMLSNIAEQLPDLMRLITAFSYLMGFFFIYRGMAKLKAHGESRTMMSGEHHLSEPMAYLVIGSFLLFLPSAVEVGLSSFWTNPNPYGYLDQQDSWGEFLGVCYSVVQFVGVLALIRGLVILSHAVGRGGGQDTFGKGMTHVVGGILCINVYQVVQAILTTLGIQTT